MALFHMAFFVFSRGAFRYFVFLPGVISSFYVISPFRLPLFHHGAGEKTKKQNNTNQHSSGISSIRGIERLYQLWIGVAPVLLHLHL